MNFLKKINFRKLITNNFWLKLASLGIAIIVWMYVSGEIVRGIRV